MDGGTMTEPSDDAPLDATERLPLPTKVAVARLVAEAAVRTFRHPVVMWTGGKDSTLVLWLVTRACAEIGVRPPPAMVVDHGTHFEETWTFLKAVAAQWDVDVLVTRNEEIVGKGWKPNDSVPVAELGPRSLEALARLGYEGDAVAYSLRTAVGNHLLKTVPLNDAIVAQGYDAVVTGIRWDENEARARERFFSTRKRPEHVRVHPILTFSERDVWTVTRDHDLPVHPLYARGYRSFDGVFDTEPTDTRPAWEQDLEASAERAGRAQDKEGIMERLRALGYF
jgi:phosphoadenosine phosphosulfate reductase